MSDTGRIPGKKKSTDMFLSPCPDPQFGEGRCVLKDELKRLWFVGSTVALQNMFLASTPDF